MSNLERNHDHLRQLAVAIAIINLVTMPVVFTNEWLTYFDPLFLICVVQPAFLIGLPSLPFLLPQYPSDNPRTATNWLIFTFTSLVVFELIWIGKVLSAIFCRDPFGAFRWPWERREFKLEVINGWNFSEWVWTGLVHQPIPADPIERELPGILLIAIFVFSVPLVAALLAPRYHPGQSFARTFVFFAVVQIPSGCTAIMAIKCLFRLKYVMSLPEWFFNI